MKLALTVLLALFLAPHSAMSQELDGTLKKIKDSGTFNLGHLETAPPFSFPGPDRRPVGYSIDLCLHIASAIQKQLGISLKLNWVPLTTDNRIDMVAQGKVDLECGTTTASLARQERVDFSLMTFVDGGGLLTATDSKLGSVTDLAGKRIALIPGTTTEIALDKFLKEHFVTIEKVPVKNHVEGLAVEVELDADEKTARVMLPLVHAVVAVGVANAVEPALEASAVADHRVEGAEGRIVHRRR